MPGSKDTHLSFIGPHEELELDLMKVGEKPLSMFIHYLDPEDIKPFPEEEFDKLVEAKALKKFDRIEEHSSPLGKTVVRRILYALPQEEWRISALLFIHDYYTSTPGRRADLERLIGMLLGYKKEDIDKYIRHHRID
jgi:hypothetical protein